ncbi:MAG: hypothetical protein PHN71_08460 [Candidatus Cloacimonetes bacterium]|jgi:hypothetical protein|nr:hypothetical protein [Candidatus Cloacimonadota bacterium]MDY0299787.1 hypothetical protein [Candidatus Cloacimonadaceae bacterium]
MGAQQLLLIVLTVIIVGIAISVGIYLFNYYNYKSNVQAILAEMQHFAAMSQSYWASPISMGGASKNNDYCDTQQMASHLGFKEKYGAKIIQITYFYISPNAEFHLEGSWNGILEINALGVAAFRGKYPYINYKYDLNNDKPEIEITARKDWEE